MRIKRNKLYTAHSFDKDGRFQHNICKKGFTSIKSIINMVSDTETNFVNIIDEEESYIDRYYVKFKSNGDTIFRKI